MTLEATAAGPLPARVGAVLFDMDNTLVASEDAWFAATQRLWAEAGGEPTGKGVLGGTVQDVVDELLREYPGSDPEVLSRRMLTLLVEHLEGGVHPTPGAQELIERLSPLMPITIASNSPSFIVAQVVAALSWEPHFTAALGTEDVARPKPAPDLYLEAAARCGVDIADCVVFEDSPMGATAAREAGAFVVTIGPDAAALGDLNVDDLTDPRILAWTPAGVPMTLLPAPRSIRRRGGGFQLPNPLPVRGGGKGARLLAERLLIAAGFNTSTDATAAGVDFVRDDALPVEAYRLEVSEAGVTVTSSNDAGELWAVQTLLQLLPSQIYGSGPMDPETLKVTGVAIEDEPAYCWRGSMIDVGRHFLPLDGLLRHLEAMAMHKLNVAHLHLTDDQGWRLPVEGYPRLTEEGAWRPGTLPGLQPPPDQNDRDDFPQHDGRRHGGSYTVEEIHQLVARADELGITIMPEIDMPGHMEAAIAAYPHLGACTHVSHPRTCFGVSHHVLALSEEVLAFCRDVLDATMELFPGSPIHIGGDECPSEEWFEDPVSLATMAANGITTGAEAQAWFERQICAHVLDAGRRVVAWDEVLEFGAPDGVTVMVWRDGASISAAAERGLDVIAATVQHTYLDYSQHGDFDEPMCIGGPVPLGQVARFADDVQLSDNRQGHLLGGQLQLWTEYVHNWTRAEYQLWPRGAVLAQQLWAGHVGQAGSQAGLAPHLPRLTAMELNWCRPLNLPAAPDTEI